MSTVDRFGFPNRNNDLRKSVRDLARFGQPVQNTPDHSFPARPLEALQPNAQPWTAGAAHWGNGFIRPLIAVPLPSLLLSAGEGQAALSQTEAIGQCLIDRTTAEDRLLLVCWVTFAFAAQSVLQDAIKVDKAKLADTNRRVAGPVTSLVAERCSAEARSAVPAEGDKTPEGKACEMLGEVASDEVMLAARVIATISALASQVGDAPLSSALTP